MVMLKINELYNSGCCELMRIITSGKKETPGVLHFKGVATTLGNGKEVRALEDGVVLYAGLDNNIHSRQRRKGITVMLTGHKGVNVSYERLSTRLVKEGDRVRAGDVIGYEGSTGSGKGEYLAMRFSRNERLVDGCEYLGIERRVDTFKPGKLGLEYVVSRIFGLSDMERAQIDTLPASAEIWRKLYERAV